MNIPDVCHALNNMTIDPKTGIGEVIEIRAMETGYYRTGRHATQSEVDQENEKLGVDKATARAMSDASVFGWHVYNNCLKSHQELEAKKKPIDKGVQREFIKILKKIKDQADK